MKPNLLYKAPSWNQINIMLLNQSRSIRYSGFKPDLIVGVSRGGWIPARILSDLLENKNLASVKVEFYRGIGEALRGPVLTQPLSVDVSGKKVLVVDEVVDLGKSLRLVLDHVKKQGADDIRTAVLYYKPNCAFKPDYCEEETECWVVFPWEIKETLREILDENKDDPARGRREISRLVESGVPQCLIMCILKEWFELSKC